MDFPAFCWCENSSVSSCSQIKLLCGIVYFSSSWSSCSQKFRGLIFFSISTSAPRSSSLQVDLCKYFRGSPTPCGSSSRGHKQPLSWSSSSCGYFLLCHLRGGHLHGEGKILTSKVKIGSF
ncbi:hypothetical protein I3843_11G122700 [Carya illinoinensis]|nr:hypothetical protein I3843_11G122700 [Carya illinoinensis]